MLRETWSVDIILNVWITYGLFTLRKILFLLIARLRVLLLVLLVSTAPALSLLLLLGHFILLGFILILFNGLICLFRQLSVDLAHLFPLFPLLLLLLHLNLLLLNVLSIKFCLIGSFACRITLGLSFLHLKFGLFDDPLLFGDLLLHLHSELLFRSQACFLFFLLLFLSFLLTLLFLLPVHPLPTAR